MTAMEPAETAGGQSGRAWRNPLTLVCLGLLVLHLALKYAPTIAGGDWPKDGGLDTVGLVLVACAALPAIAPHVTSAKLPGGVELAFREVRRRQRMNEAEIAQLRFIVDGFVTDGELQHLRNIQHSVGYRPAGKDLPILEAELRRLLALRLVDRREGHLGVRNFALADGKERRIGEWFRLMPRGIEYLAMREQAEADRAASKE
jgi:hypothetical protein